MSKASDAFEYEIVQMVNRHIGECLPGKLPAWMKEEGIVPEARIRSVEGIGSKDKANKTDVIIHLDGSAPIKISAKLMNADYFGNWYGHQRFLQEFGKEAFDRMTVAATAFANKWSVAAKVPFVGVSICFGRRIGKTGQNFTEIFTQRDILTVARGFGEGDAVANCMYVANHSAKTIPELINNLEAITEETVMQVTGQFKVAYRPINPLTEGSNRGKNVYTRFRPYNRLPERTVVRDPGMLFSLGKFVTVEPTRLNHNHILDELEREYNIVIPRKNETAARRIPYGQRRGGIR